MIAGSMSTATASPRNEFWAGATAIVPLIVGAVPFGIIFGAVSVTSGLTPAAAAAMSAFVFAGSSQFVATGMVAAGASAVVIVVTTFVVNIRHSLYAVTLAPHLQGYPQRWLAPLGFLLTDEAFMIVVQRFGRRDNSPYRHWFYLGAGLAMYVNWQLCTWVGIWAGQVIPNPRAWGLEFALPLTFIGMLVPSLTSRPLVLAATAAGLSALALRGLPNQMGLIIAILVGVATGIISERFTHTAGTPDIP